MARRERKRHQQIDLLTKDGTRPKTRRAANKRTNRGGRRVPVGKRKSEPHRKRVAFRTNTPVHVVLRVERRVQPLRRRKLFKAIREATLVAARRDDARIIHLSIQRSHIHLIVEADDRMALAGAMKAFQISAAKNINRALTNDDGERPRGRVFIDRYHAEIITSPRQMHRALGYVLNNWRKHEEDQSEQSSGWRIDPFSSAQQFDGWKERDEIERWPTTYEELIVRPARSWILTSGWRKHGLISCWQIPSRPLL